MKNADDLSLVWPQFNGKTWRGGMCRVRKARGSIGRSEGQVAQFYEIAFREAILTAETQEVF